MNVCKICQAPLYPPRRVFCSDDCYGADQARRERERYQNDPDHARRKNAHSRAWVKANAKRCYAAVKARKLAAVLAKARS